MFALGSLATAHAQPLATRDRPSEERLPLPQFRDVEPGSGRVLPRIVLPETPEVGAVPRFFARDFRFSGNTVLETEALEAIARPFTHRLVDFADLERLRDALTRAYVDAGFATSGAWIPDQRVVDGVVDIEILEGRLGRVDVDTTGRFSAAYVRSRLAPIEDGPLDIGALEEQLQLLRQDPLVASVDAQIVPGERRGLADLELTVHEVPPFAASLYLDNYEPTSIGEAAAHSQVVVRDPSGLGDFARFDSSFTQGLRDLSLEWNGPLPRRETRVGFHVRYATSKVVEEPFDDLDIESRSFTAGLRVEQPLWRDLRNDLRLVGLGEWRRTTTYLLGSPFSFVPGPEDGESVVTALRLGPEWTYRSADQVFAARSVVSIGLDLLGATIHTGDAPDGRFVSWLNQLQWARRLPFPLPGTQVIARLDSQLADGPLLSLEQFSLGGRFTVRGYDEDLVVRDGAVNGSLELRIPILHRADDTSLVELAPFVDAAYGWNYEREAPGPPTLVGAGVGVRVALTRWARLEVYWGKQLIEAEEPPGWSLQGDGVHAQFSVVMP